jgi:Methyltransferase domain
MDHGRRLRLPEAYGAQVLLKLLPFLVAVKTTCAACPDGLPILEDSRCLCPPGKGGNECQFSLESLYFDHAATIYRPRARLRPMQVEGWGVSPGVYRRMADNVTAQFMAEIGVWKGASTIEMAKYLKEKGRGVIVAVDTWLGALEFWDKRFGVDDPTRNLQWQSGFPTVYYTFLANVIHSNLTDYVIPFPAPSKLASDYFLEKNLFFDLLHVDAGHDFEDCLEDIKLWWRNLRPGGVMIGDDYIPFWHGVVKAVKVFAAQNDLELEVDGVKWILMKPK